MLTAFVTYCSFGLLNLNRYVLTILEWSALPKFLRWLLIYCMFLIDWRNPFLLRTGMKQRLLLKAILEEFLGLSM